MKKNPFQFLPLAVAALLILTNCQNDAAKDRPTRDPNRVSVMTFNVENLFDTLPDSDRDDFTYLPLELKRMMPDHAELCKKMGAPAYVKECLEMDWSEKVLATKLNRVADTILQVHGMGPDVLLVQEVENLNVLTILNNKHLKAARYQTAELLEGEDKRGIDVGVLSRYPLAEPTKIHSIEFTSPPPPPAGQPPKPWVKPATRGILEVALRLPTGETLYVFTFHFPSQSNPTWQRRDAVNTLNKLIEAKGPNAFVIAGGDCNITESEDAKNKYIRGLLASKWTVSHLAGCKGCQGTEAFFEKNKETGKTKLSWSFFDILLFSPSLAAGSGHYKLDPASIQIQNNGRYQMRIDKEFPGILLPSRFDEKSSPGVSDHWPMYAELAFKSKAQDAEGDSQTAILK